MLRLHTGGYIYMRNEMNNGNVGPGEGTTTYNQKESAVVYEQA